MAYPSILSSFSNPQASDRLNSPSHSSLHQAENAAITEIETFVGTLSSLQGSLVYDIRSPNSNGGGHVQVPNTGGTGQTAYTKGDLLIATSSSVLAKLAVGTDGQVLQADSSQSAGAKWSAVIANKIAIVSSTAGVSGTSSLTTLYTASIVGSTLGTNNAIRFTVPISQFQMSATGRGVNIFVNYGNNRIFTLNAIAAPAGIGGNNYQGAVEGMIVADNSSALQKGYATFVAGSGNGGNVPSSVFTSGVYGTSSVESGANQTLIVQAQLTGANQLGSVLGEALVVEKIV